MVVIFVTGGNSGTEKRAPKGTPVHALKRPAGISPQRRKVRGPHNRPVPILMYHVVSNAPAGAPYPDLYVPRDEFAAQMQGLAAGGFHGVTLGQVFDYWRRGIALPRRPVVVSFDDGYKSQYQNALPVLKKLGWPGVLNLLVKNEKPSWGLQPASVRKLIAAGWEVDAHTIHHLDLTTLNGAALYLEVAGSRRLIQRQFGVPVNFFAYPSGRFNAKVIATVRAAGFLGATTVQPGLARPGERFTLPRVRINGSDGPGAPVQKLRALGD